MGKIIFIFVYLTACFTASAQFITRSGAKLVAGPDGKEIHLQGISLGNGVWQNEVLPYLDHNEDDFERIRRLGMNTVRFYINYRTFEDDATPFTYKEAGFEWLDTNIEWAKKNDIYLILNIHVPQGGFQSNCKGDSLWKIQSNQDRLVALWQAIATRYSDETQIAGYDLLNEPTPSDSVARWTHLAQRIIDSIRTADKNHLIIVEKAIAVNCNYEYNDGNGNFPVLKEDNLMYTFHFYEPYYYTYQLTEWAGTGDGGKYPDDTISVNYSGSGQKEGIRNSDWLLNQVLKTSKYPVEKGYPVYCGEFGCVQPCFQNNKGGEIWVRDMMNIFDSLGISFTYHAYHDLSFGLYPGPYGPLDTTKLNRTLQQEFLDFFLH